MQLDSQVLEANCVGVWSVCAMWRYNYKFQLKGNT